MQQSANIIIHIVKVSSSTQLIQGISLQAVSKIPVHIPDEADSVSGTRNEGISISAHDDSLYTLNDSEITPTETPDISSLQYLTHQISNQYDAGDILAIREKAISTCKKTKLASS